MQLSTAVRRHQMHHRARPREPRKSRRGLGYPRRGSTISV